MRLIYIDEAGTSRHEPVSVVTGIILDADSRWDLVAAAIDEIRREFVPVSEQPGYVFHATDLFGGGKKFEGWSDHARWKALERIVEIPQALKLAVAIGYTRRSKDVSLRGWKKQLEVEHLHAFALCLVGAAEFMQKRAPGETAVVVAEDNQEMRSRLRNLPAKLRDSATPKSLSRGMSFDSIKDVVHFCSKQGAPILQIADACAFTFRRHVASLKHGDHFFKKLTGVSYSVDRSLHANHVLFDWNTASPPDTTARTITATTVKFPKFTL